MLKHLKKNRIIFAGLLLFLIVSFLFINPTIRKSRSEYHSSQLRRITIKDESQERTDYVDSSNRITIAADLGYASIIDFRIDNKVLEQYFDESGEPISRYNGYYSMLKEYDEIGNNIRNTYLNQDGFPVITANGYAIEEKKYNEQGQTVSVQFYGVDGEPVLTPLYGYGKTNEYYANGKISRIIYTDVSGVPMMTAQGYASVTMNYYETEGVDKGKVESEFYFDDMGKPVALSLGQYGIHKEYNELGQGSVITYLDAEGHPIKTNKGYTTIKRTYHANSSIATEQYYDMAGEPFALPEGQYGVKKEGNQVVYLNQNGKKVFNLKNLLFNDARIAILTAIFIVFISGMIGRKMNIVLLIMYICAIGYMTIMFRETNNTSNHEILWYYKKIFADSEARADILKNIWLFIPFGAIMYQMYPKMFILLIPIIFSVLIEGIQYFSGLGFCELDDVISNSLGGFIGYIMGKLTTDIITRIKSWRHIHIS